MARAGPAEATDLGRSFVLDRREEMGVAPRSEDVVMTTDNESDRPPVQNSDQYEKRGLQFLALCLILTAMLFILIDAVVYFTAPTGKAPSSTEAFETAKPANKAMPVLP